MRAKPSVAGQHRVLATEVAGLPAQHVAEQHRGFVVEVVTGRDDVVAVLERGRVEEVALREPARAARRAARDLRGAGDVEAVVRREVDDVQLEAARLGERVHERGRTPRSTRRCRARGTGRRRRSSSSTRRSHSARESLPPDTATRIRSPGSNMSYSWIARRTCSRQWCRKQSLQNAALWRRMSMTAGALQRRHFIPLTAPPPEITGRISIVSESARRGVLGHEGVALDHEDRFGVQLEARQQLRDRHRAGHLHLAPGVAEQDFHRRQATGRGGFPGSRRPRPA